MGAAIEKTKKDKKLRLRELDLRELKEVKKCTGCDLIRADLSGADLTGVVRTDFTGAILD